MAHDAVTEIRICNLEEDAKEMKDKFETLRVILNELADAKNDELKDKIKTIGYPFVDVFEEERRKRERAKQNEDPTKEQLETVLHIMRFLLRKNGFVSVKDLDDAYEYLDIPIWRPKRTNEDLGWSNLDAAIVAGASAFGRGYALIMPTLENRKMF